MPAAPNIHAWIMHRAILTYLSSLTVTQGPKRGEPFEVLPWERMFIRGAFAVDDDVALSMGRGGGKTTFVAALACAIRDPDGPLHEKAEATDAVIAASSFGQGLRPFRAVQRFLAAKGYDLHDRKVWRMHDYHAMNASVSRIARSTARQPRHRGTAWIGPTWPRPPSAAGTCRGPGRSPTPVSRASRGWSLPPISLRPPLGAAVISANPRDERPYQGTEPPNCTTRWASPWTSFRCPISSPIETCLPEVIRTPRTSA